MQWHGHQLVHPAKELYKFVVSILPKELNEIIKHHETSIESKYYEPN